MFKIDIPSCVTVTLAHSVRQQVVMCWMQVWAWGLWRKRKNKQRTDYNWRWPVQFRTNDLRTAFWREGGQLLGCVRASSSTGGRRMRRGEEKDREAGSHLLQRATTFPSSPCCLPCDSQAGRQNGIRLPLSGECKCTALSSTPMTVCILHSSLFKRDNAIPISNEKW